MSRITNDVNQVQQAVSETIGDLLREGLALFGYAALLFYYDARLALVVMTGAPLDRLPAGRGSGQRVRKTTRRSQEQLEHISHISAEAFAGTASSRRSARRTSRRERFAAASELVYRTNMKVTSALSALPPLMEFLGGLGHGRRALVRQPADWRGRA